MLNLDPYGFLQQMADIGQLALVLVALALVGQLAAILSSRDMLGPIARLFGYQRSRLHVDLARARLTSAPNRRR